MVPNVNYTAMKTASPQNRDPQVGLWVLAVLTAYLAIDLFPVVDRIDIARLQFLYLNIINIGVVLLFALGLIGRYPAPPVWKHGVLLAYITFVCLAGASYLAAANKSLALLCISQLLVSATMVTLICTLLQGYTRLIPKVVLLIAIIGTVQSLALLNGLQSAAPSEILGALEGNAGNPNIFAASMLWKIPLVLFGIAYGNPRMRWPLSIALLPMATCIFLINSRSSLVGLLLLVLASIAYLARYRNESKMSWAKAAHLVLPVVAALVTANVVFHHLGLSGRFESTASRIMQITPDESSAQARLSYWAQALTFASENPLQGIGVGNWMIANTPYMGSDYIFSVHTHNDFLEVAAETGIVNGLLYLAIFGALLTINLRRVLRPTDAKQRAGAFLALMLLLVYAVDASFNFPLYRPTMQVCFAILMGLTIANGRRTGNHAAPATPTIQRTVTTLLFAAALAPLYASYHADRTALLENRLVSDDIDNNFSPSLTGDQIVAFGPKIPNVAMYSSVSFAEYAGICYFREKRYAEALRQFDLANAINPHFGRPDFYKYLMAKERDMPDSAYHYLKKSFYTAPSGYGGYQQAIREAGTRGDTTEVLAMYGRYVATARQPKPAALEDASWALQSSGYPLDTLIALVKKENADRFQGDTTIQKRLDGLTITSYLVEGQQWFAASRYDLALARYQDALGIDPTSPYALQNIGFYHYTLGDPGLAIPYLRKSISKPGLQGGKTEYYLAVCYQQIGDMDNACVYATLAKNNGFSDAAGLVKQTCLTNRE